MWLSTIFVSLSIGNKVNGKFLSMYFEAKAFNRGTRRFENLDNFQELQDFCAKYVELGFNKLIVKAFDCNGFKSRTFYSLDEYGQFIKFYRNN